MLLVFLFLYLPIFVLIVFSFNASKSRSVWSGFTLDWYKELFQNSMILDALWVTLAVSILAAVISTIIGTAAAIGFTNFRRRSRTVVTTINNIPLTNADIITGVSMMLFFVLAVNVFNGTLGAALGIKWNLGFVTLLIAHLTFDIPHVILCVMPKLQQLDPNIYEAAQDLGAPGFLAPPSPPCPWSSIPWPRSGSARRSTPCPPCSSWWWSPYWSSSMYARPGRTSAAWFMGTDGYQRQPALI